ncbi:hypothetical protein U2104_14145 [Listeria monocytogenes]|uniref:LexA family protein n=1 Tax=Listeria monocytogenes TaxID=1639 RepID=UPI002FDC1A0A
MNPALTRAAFNDIADYFGVLKSTIDPRYGEISKNLIPVEKYRQIPVLGEIACGDPILAEKNIEEYREEIDENLHKNNPKTNNTLFFECSVFG